MPELFLIREVCERLRITDRTFRAMVARGEFPQPLRRNRRWVRVPAADLEAYLKKLEESRRMAR